MISIKARYWIINIYDCLFEILGLQLLKFGKEVGEGNSGAFAIAQVLGDFAVRTNEPKLLLVCRRVFGNNYLDGFTAQHGS
ncbi:hypothetical protein D3C76_1492820 [compost metagenome]